MWDRKDAHELSQNEVARRAGVSTGHPSQIMSGKANPSPGALKRLHGVLLQRPKTEERVMPAEVRVLGWRKGERSGMVLRGAGGTGSKVGGGTIRVGGHAPWGAKVEYAFRTGYDGRGRLSQSAASLLVHWCTYLLDRQKWRDDRCRTPGSAADLMSYSFLIPRQPSGKDVTRNVVIKCCSCPRGSFEWD